MPYIAQESRGEFSPHACGVPHATKSGELNFQITELLGMYWHAHGPNYQCINDILGALEGAKAEFYRRIAVPYEMEKIKQNGDVWI